jgi:hypothetical protein
MSTGEKITRAGKGRRKLDGLPDLLPHRAVAEKMGVSPEVLRDWVARGVFPEPHSAFEHTWLYRADLIREWLETGAWPEGVKFRRVRPE